MGLLAPTPAAGVQKFPAVLDWTSQVYDRLLLKPYGAIVSNCRQRERTRRRPKEMFPDVVARGTHYGDCVSSGGDGWSDLGAVYDSERYDKSRSSDNLALFRLTGVQG
jgi:hypothetical protein